MILLSDIAKFARDKDKIKRKKRKSEYGFKPFSEEAKSYRKRNLGKMVRAAALPLAGGVGGFIVGNKIGGAIGRRVLKGGGTAADRFANKQAQRVIDYATIGIGTGVGLKTVGYVNSKTLNRPGYFSKKDKRRY